MSDSREETFRTDICEIGKRLWQRGLVAAHDGNISVRLEDSKLLCTPSGVSKGYMTPKDLVVVDNEGQKLHGAGTPSSELKMHLEVYRRRPDVSAIVHAHPPHATAFAVSGLDVPNNIMPEIDVLLGKVATVPYIRPGTWEFARAVGDFAKESDALLLGNHGASTCGMTLEQAWFRMESLDHCCKILLLAHKTGTWKQMQPE